MVKGSCTSVENGDTMAYLHGERAHRVVSVLQSVPQWLKGTDGRDRSAHRPYIPCATDCTLRM
jgi:hypothetical protein